MDSSHDKFYTLLYITSYFVTLLEGLPHVEGKCYLPIMSPVSAESEASCIQ